MKLFSAITLLSYLLINQSSAIEISHDQSYVYFLASFKEIKFGDRIQAIKESQDIVLEAVESAFPNTKMRDYVYDSLDEELNRELDVIIENVQSYANSEHQGYFRTHHLMPGAFVFFFGAKFSANLKIGGGGEGLVAIPVIPAKVYRINKITKEVEEFWTVMTSASIMPAVNLGFGSGGGGRFKLGLGMIWGHINTPRDFRGLTGSFTFGKANLVGWSMTAGVTIGMMAIKQFFAAAFKEFGATQTVELHGGLGWTWAATELNSYSLIKQTSGGSSTGGRPRASQRTPYPRPNTGKLPGQKTSPTRPRPSTIEKAVESQRLLEQSLQNKDTLNEIVEATELGMVPLRSMFFPEKIGGTSGREKITYQINTLSRKEIHVKKRESKIVKKGKKYIPGAN